MAEYTVIEVLAFLVAWEAAHVVTLAAAMAAVIGISSAIRRLVP